MNRFDHRRRTFSRRLAESVLVYIKNAATGGCCRAAELRARGHGRTGGVPRLRTAGECRATAGNVTYRRGHGALAIR